MSLVTISLSPWSTSTNQQAQSQHTLFNCDSIASACELEGNKAFSLEINNHKYLAYKRHASAVIGGLSLQDMTIMLNNMPLVREQFSPIGVHTISLNSWNAENDKDALSKIINANSQMRFEFVIDTQKYLPSKISSNHKRNIKKAVKANTTPVLVSGVAAMQDHIHLVNENLANKGESGITNSAGYFQHLIEQSAGLLMQVKEGQQLIASTFFIINDAYVYYHSSGTSKRGKEIGAAHFLVDNMIKEMQQRAIRYLNLGGCTAEQSGLYRFKLGFRPETRILFSAHRRITTTGKQKVRSLLSTKANDILSVEKVNIYSKEKSLQTYDVVEYTLQQMDFVTLFEAVSDNPELSRSLAIFCRPSPYCYAVLDEKKKIVAVGFIETVDQNKQSLTNKHKIPQNCAEITHAYVINNERNKGIGRVLMVLVEQQAFLMGFEQLYVRISATNIASQKMCTAIGYKLRGDERIISTRLLGGKSMIVGAVTV